MIINDRRLVTQDRLRLLATGGSCPLVTEAYGPNENAHWTNCLWQSPWLYFGGINWAGRDSVICLFVKNPTKHPGRRHVFNLLWLCGVTYSSMGIRVKRGGTPTCYQRFRSLGCYIRISQYMPPKSTSRNCPLFFIQGWAIHAGDTSAPSWYIRGSKNLDASAWVNKSLFWNLS